jgi:hypothetical protein
MNTHFISLDTAKELIGRYRDNFNDMVNPAYSESLKYSETFDATAIRAIIDQPGCVELGLFWG